MFAAWRHVYPGNIRDIAFTASRDGGRTFAAPLRVSEDKWVLEGCPDDGPAMAVDANNRIHIVWPTLITEGAAEQGAHAEKDGSAQRSSRSPRSDTGEPTIALFYATSADGTRRAVGSPPRGCASSADGHREDGSLMTRGTKAPAGSGGPCPHDGRCRRRRALTRWSEAASTRSSRRPATRRSSRGRRARRRTRRFR